MEWEYLDHQNSLGLGVQAGVWSRTNTRLAWLGKFWNSAIFVNVSLHQLRGANEILTIQIYKNPAGVDDKNIRNQLWPKLL